MILIILRRWKLLRFGGPGPGCGGTGVRFSLAVARVAVVGKGRGSRLALLVVVLGSERVSGMDFVRDCGQLKDPLNVHTFFFFIYFSCGD